jgi:hypothetical protein
MHGNMTMRWAKIINSSRLDVSDAIFPVLGSQISPQAPAVKAVVLLMLGFLALATALRWVFVGWGLPYIYQGDEPWALSVIHRMIRESDLDPRVFYYPSFFYYVNIPGQYLVKWWDGALLPLKMQSFGNGFTGQPAAFLAGRTTTLLFGLATLPVLMLWGRAVSLGLVGLVVLGGLFCLDPLLLRHATFITPDIFTTFFTTCALFASSLIVLRGDRWTYILAAVMAGLAASSKYNAGLVSVAILAAHVLRSGFAIAELRPLVVAAVITGCVFVLSSPFIVLDPRTAAAGIASVMRHYQTGHLGYEGHSLAANAGWMFDNLGWAGLLACVACFSPRLRALLPTILFTIAYFLLLVVQYVRFDRNLLPFIPAMLLLIAVGVDLIAQTVARALPNAWRRVSSAFVGILALALSYRPVALSVDEIIHYRADPRAEARTWVNALLPRTPGRPVAVDAYAPYVSERGRTVTGIDLILAMDRNVLAPYSALVLSRQGSGRFFGGPYDTERANFADLKARACDYQQFPADGAEPDYFVFDFKCN